MLLKLVKPEIYERVRYGGRLWAGVTGCPLECSNFLYGHTPHYGRRFFRVFLSTQFPIQRLSRPGMRHILGLRFYAPPDFFYTMLSLGNCVAVRITPQSFSFGKTMCGMPFHSTYFWLRTITPTTAGLDKHHNKKQN
jgi:hypothetical protein